MVVKRIAVAAVLAAALVVGFVAGYRAFHERKREAAARELRRVSEQGLSRLREAFNRNACASIYEEASDGFRKAITSPEWLKRCESLRASMGPWRGYQVQLYEIPGKHDADYAQLEGEATFAQGEFSLTSWWSMKSGRAELCLLSLNKQGEDIWIPSFEKTVPGKQFLDPPPPRDRYPG
jgi:hypothetical protein